MAVLFALLFPYLVLAHFAVAFLTSEVAYQKGRFGGPWFVLSFLLGPVALLAVIGIPDRPKVREEREALKAARVARFNSTVAGIFKTSPAPEDAGSHKDQF